MFLLSILQVKISRVRFYNVSTELMYDYVIDFIVVKFFFILMNSVIVILRYLKDYII